MDASSSLTVNLDCNSDPLRKYIILKVDGMLKAQGGSVHICCYVTARFSMDRSV